uniref:Transmembrane protein 238 like n=1 Tax=Lates calcarifer TaxID=8187 RepID=A0A4W6CNE2_LATCA
KHSSPVLYLQTTSTCPPSPGLAMEQGRFTILFVSLAVILDVVGLVLFFVGIFAPLSFWDFFVLSGPLLIFLSLVFWIFWYLGNLTVSEEELSLHKPDILWKPYCSDPPPPWDPTLSAGLIFPNCLDGSCHYHLNHNCAHQCTIAPPMREHYKDNTLPAGVRANTQKE